LADDANQQRVGSRALAAAPQRESAAVTSLRAQHIHRVERGDTWGFLARSYGKSIAELQRDNPDIVHLRTGSEVIVWLEGRPPKFAPPRYVSDTGARSRGAPNDGALENGIQLPDSPNYRRRAPFNMWGSGFAVTQLQIAAAIFRQRVGPQRKLVISDLSRQHGRAFPPHKSHQSGRDVDIWLPTANTRDDGDTRQRKPKPNSVDWHASWLLVQALCETGSVQYIFLEWQLQAHLYEAALELGVTAPELARILQWPRLVGTSTAIVRHAPNHTGHVHVRFRCGHDESHCVSGARVPPDVLDSASVEHEAY
jgi:hypothetical protein